MSQCLIIYGVLSVFYGSAEAKKGVADRFVVDRLSIRLAKSPVC